MLAESFGLWVITNMYYEITEGRIFTETMPYMAGGMLSDDEHIRNDTLGRMRVAWLALQRLEGAAIENNDIRKYIQQMWWPNHGYLREICISAQENDFTALPDIIVNELRMHSLCPKSTVDVETQFRELRGKERQHAASKLGKFARWHHCIHSAVLPEMDRPRLVVNGEHRSYACSDKELDIKDFQARHGKIYSDPDIVKNFLTSKPKFNVLAPERFFHTAESTRNMLATYTEGLRNDDLVRAACSLLAEPMTYICKKRDRTVGGLVLGSSEHAVVCWIGRAAHEAGQRFWFSMGAMPTPADACPGWRHVAITNPAEWECVDLEVCPPCHKRGCRPPIPVGSTHPGLYFISKAAMPPISLSVAAANKAFYQLTVAQVKTLGDTLGVKWGKPKPKTTHAVCKAVMKHCFRDTKTDEEIDNIIKDWRGATHKAGHLGSLFGRKVSSFHLKLSDSSIDQRHPRHPPHASMKAPWIHNRSSFFLVGVSLPALTIREGH